MDDPCPVKYSDFEARAVPLSVGALRRYATRVDFVWDPCNVVQVLAVLSSPTEGKTMMVTDGESVAKLSFTSIAHNCVVAGSVVELLGMEIADAKLCFSEINLVLDPESNDLPMVDTSAMPLTEVVVPAPMDVAAARQNLPDTFAQYRAERKRTAASAEMSAAGAAPKSAVATPVTRPPERNPISQCPLLSIPLITAGRQDFGIGPVVVRRLFESRPTANGGNSPTRIEFADEHGNGIIYSTWSKTPAVCEAFANYTKTCFYVCRGVAADSYPNSSEAKLHPCKVNFGIPDGTRNSVSDNMKLVVRPGTDEELRWVLQELRRLSKAVDWDPIARDDPRNSLSVIEALEAGTNGQRKLVGVRISGVLDSIVPSTTQGGQPYYKIVLTGRQSAETDSKLLYLNLWSSATKGVGQVITHFSSEGYNRALSQRQNVAVCVTSITITPGVKYPFSTTNDTEVLLTNEVPEAQMELVSKRSLIDNPVKTLADLMASPVGMQANVYFAVAYATEKRPFRSRNTGSVSHMRLLAFMDDSKDQTGNYCGGSFMAFERNPVLAPLLAATEEVPPAITVDAPTGGVRRLIDPSRVVIVFAMGVTLQAPNSGSSRAYPSFRDTHFRVISPSDGDARAEELRSWYIAKGHIHFVPCVTLDREFEKLGSTYDELDAVLRQGSRMTSSSSSAAAAAQAPMKLSDVDSSLLDSFW